MLVLVCVRVCESSPSCRREAAESAGFRAPSCGLCACAAAWLRFDVNAAPRCRQPCRRQPPGWQSQAGPRLGCCCQASAFLLGGAYATTCRGLVAASAWPHGLAPTQVARRARTGAPGPPAPLADVRIGQAACRWHSPAAARLRARVACVRACAPPRAHTRPTCVLFPARGHPLRDQHPGAQDRCQCGGTSLAREPLEAYARRAGAEAGTVVEMLGMPRAALLPFMTLTRVKGKVAPAHRLHRHRNAMRASTRRGRH